MKLKQLLSWAEDKTRFNKIEDYSNFCEKYLAFIHDGLQAVIVAQNENNYRFFQYKKDGNFNISRPVNSNLMLSLNTFLKIKSDFIYLLEHVREIKNNQMLRQNINSFIYTCQQSIGVALDAMPSGKSNKARKIFGDLFERYIRLILSKIGINVRDGVIYIPVIINNEEMFNMLYQHDLIIEQNGNIKAIGSVKTSSKDRLDKIFIDKLLYNKLTGTSIPHFAIFLNDVQRKGRQPKFGVNTTFLTGHFKGYTIKLNPLDGVYYCDLRPNMISDSLLKEQIRSLDTLLVEDIWKFI